MALFPQLLLVGVTLGFVDNYGRLIYDNGFLSSVYNGLG